MTFDPELHALAVERDRQRARLNRAVVAGIVTLAMSGASYVLLKLYGITGWDRLLYAALGGIIGAAVILAGVRASTFLSEAVLRGLFEPGGRGRNLAVDSRALALAAQGDFAAAAEAFDALRAQHGQTAVLLRSEVEMQLRPGGDRERARDLLLRLRQAADAAPADELYATHRLIDLYLGVLDDAGRAMVELRRMADRFPDTPDGQGALAELRRRRIQLAQDYEQT